MTTATQEKDTAAQLIGQVLRVVGPVIDVQFNDALPPIYSAITVEDTNSSGQKIHLVAEIQQMLGDNSVRAVAMSGTEGLSRGMKAYSNGQPISVPVGEKTLGRIFNVLGEREIYSEKTLAQLYDPDKMPDGLREAHHQLDLAVENCYRSKPFESDEERLEYLFKLYEQMIEEEKSIGTLFEIESKPKKKKK
jgi:hypothetical protein